MLKQNRVRKIAQAKNTIITPTLLHEQLYQPLSPPKKIILHNKLLYPGKFFLHKPLTPWAIELMTAIQAIAASADKQKHAFKIAEIYQHAIEIFIAIGDMKSARELCYSQIQLFMTWGEKLKEDALIKYSFQPWMSLSRIDRLDGQFHEAIKKLNIVCPANVTQLSPSPYASPLLHRLLHFDDEIKQTLNEYHLLETMCTYLASKQYLALNDFISAKKKETTIFYHPAVQEALAVVLANTGKIQDAFILLSHAKTYSDKAMIPIFRLRECEMRATLGDAQQASAELTILSKLALRLLKTTHVNKNDILFSLHVAAIFSQLALKEEAAKVAYYCLMAAEDTHDELLKAESLVMLYQLVQTTEAERLIEDLMIEHYFNTQYFVAKQQMLAYFVDLKHVESKYTQDAMCSLFEELLLFSHLAYLHA